MTIRTPEIDSREEAGKGAGSARLRSAAHDERVSDLSFDGARRVNAMTIDVEDYFQVTALSERISRDDWPHFALRVERNTETILGLLAERQINATFFTLGWVAERCPALIRRIADAGHELASHGFAHIRVGDQDAAAFAADVGRTRRLLEDVSGVPVCGYRAASFSLAPDMAWAYEELQRAGYRYSSSLHPIHHDLYGAADAPRRPFRPVSEISICEIPVSTLALFGARVPCGGGGYFRLLPYEFSRWAIRRLHRAEGAPCVFYFHPWEVDPEQPRVAGLSAKSRFRHYTKLRAMEPKLARLFDDFAWTRLDKVYADVIPD